MELEDAIRMIGYQNADDYFKRFAGPVIILSLLLFVLSFAVVYIYGPMLNLGQVTNFLVIIPLFILVAGLISAVIYPYYGVEKIRVNIHENIHYFITYAGALSTLHLPRKHIFRLAAQRVEYGEIARTMEKVTYLSDYWNLSLVTTCRKLSTLVPSKVLGNFLDRMSAAFDFGERLDTFLLQEQEAVMEDFATEYKQSLQTLSLIQDALVSLTIAVAFMMAISFMLPLIMGYDIYLLVGLSGLSLLMIDIMSIVFIDTFITHDNLCHNLPIKPEEYQKIKRVLYPIIAISSVLFMISMIFRPLPWTSVMVALSLSPLAIIGYMGFQLDGEVFKRDLAFPAFIRSLGGSMSARGGSLYGTLGPLRVHEFGVLNTPVEALYRRLKVRCDKFKSWMYFAGETGSSLIERYGSIFIQIISLGGDAEKASVIVSRNFIKLISLRELRMQLASSVKGVYYGTLLGVSGAAFASLRMVGLLDQTFKKSFSSIASSPSVSSLTQGLLPSIGQINLPLVEDILFFILLLHALFSAYSVKMVDGGTKYAAFLDFVVMVWFLTIVAIAVPAVFDYVFTQGGSASSSVTAVAGT